MEHVQPCEKIIEIGERVAGLEKQRESDHSWIEDIDKDHEQTKKELANVKIKLAVLVTAATLAGNLLYGLIDRLWP